VKDTELFVFFEEIRQYFYCKRIIYFREILGFKGYTSYKMKKGKEYHERKFKRNEIVKIKNIWLENKNEKIAGFVDYIRESKKNNEKIIGDYKQKKPYGERIPKHYKMQLIAEKLAVKTENEEKLKKVEISLPKGKKIVEEVTKEEIKEVKEAIKEIRKMKREQVFPEQAKEKGKCINCEYKNICQPL